MSLSKQSGTSRRRFLATGLAALAAPSAVGHLAGRRGLAGTIDNPYAPFEMGIQSYSLREFGLLEALTKTEELGLQAWEVYSAHVPTDSTPGAIAKIRQEAQTRHVTISGFGVQRFTNDHDANAKLFEFGKSLAIKYFSADPDPDSFESLDRLVEEFDIAVGIHNHGPGHRYGPIASIRDAIRDHHAKIGCCIDTGHFLRSGEDPLEAVEVFNDRIYGVHLKDVKDGETFTVLGQGDLRIADLLKALADRDYSYCLALEYEENPADPIADIRACLEATKAALPKG